MAVNVEKKVKYQDPTLAYRIKDTFSLIFASKTATVGLAIVCFWIFVAIFAPLLTSYTPLEQNMMAVNSGPSAEHLLGTDDLGRDLMARLFYGARRILFLAPLAVFCSLIVGAAMGLSAGYYGGWIDDVIMRILDGMMAFPPILLYLLIIAAVGPSAANVVLAITIAGAPGIARLIRSLTLDIKTREYVKAAQLRGESAFYIMVVEILINARGPVMVDCMLRVGYAIIAIGTLGFLGLGLPPPSPDWGSMVARARRYIWVNPWAVLWPTISISSIVVGLNLFVDGIREQT